MDSVQHTGDRELRRIFRNVIRNSSPILQLFSGVLAKVDKKSAATSILKLKLLANFHF